MEKQFELQITPEELLLFFSDFFKGRVTTRNI